MHIRLLLLTALLISVMPIAAQDDPAARQARALRRTPIVDVFEASRDAVVNISSTEIVQVRDPFFQLFPDFDELFQFGRPRSRPREYKRTSVGSGFVIHPDGYIITNAHVIARSTDRTVTFADGREFDAQVVATDREHDIAMLRLEAGQSLPTLRLGRSDDLMVGETVIAIGNPFGYQNTVTTGVISAVGRDLEISRDTVLRGLIQTDASINPGNSGGPLLNVFGELIGVNTAIRSDAQNIGFAIPVDQLRALIPDLLDIERRYRIESGLKLSRQAEPRVVFVADNSPAQEAGIRRGDRVREINGAPINESVDYHIAMIGRQAGEALRLKLLRDNRLVEVTLRLKGRPKPDAAKLVAQRIGVAVRPVPADVARDLRLAEGTGLLIVQVRPGSPAAGVGIEPGDILEALGRYHMTTLGELGEILEFIDPGDRIDISVLRIDPPKVYRHRVTIRAG